MIIETYNATLLDFYTNNWPNEDLFGTVEDWRPPVFAPKPIKAGSLLFIGFNPSMQKDERMAWETESIITSDHHKLLKHGTDGFASFQKNWAYNKLDIFKTRTAIAARLKVVASHLDLYPFRGTKQNKATSVFRDARKSIHGASMSFSNMRHIR